MQDDHPQGVQLFAEPNAEGYYGYRRLPDGRLLTVVALSFGRARLTIGRDFYTYDEAW